MAKCKITVLKCLFDKDLKERFIHDDNYGVCPFFKEGDVFYSESGKKPAGFECKVGWKSIADEAAGMCSDNPFFKEHVVCCNDGVRPVIFLLENIAE